MSNKRTLVSGTKKLQGAKQDDEQCQTIFNVNSTKNSGQEIYGNGNKVKVINVFHFSGDYNRFNVLYQLDTSSGEESSETSGSDCDEHPSSNKSRKARKKENATNNNDNSACDGKQFEVKKGNLGNSKSESRLCFDKKMEGKNDDDTQTNKSQITAKESVEKNLEDSEQKYFYLKAMKRSKKILRKSSIKNVLEQNRSTESNLAQPAVATNESKPRIDGNVNKLDKNEHLSSNSPRQLRRRTNETAKHSTTSKTKDENESTNGIKSTKPGRKSLAPLHIAIIQMICYSLCIVVGCFMDWPLWILPYIYYLIFVLINLLACISCVKLKFVKPDNKVDTRDDTGKNTILSNRSITPIYRPGSLNKMHK